MKNGRERDAAVERLLQRSIRAGDSPAADACPDAETFAAWVDGGLARHEMGLIEAHASECGRCQALLAAVIHAAPEPSVSASQETWRSGWALRWLVPFAATAAAAVILWVALPNDQRRDLPGQASVQLPSASPAPPQLEADADRFKAPAVAAERPGPANATTAAKDATTAAKADENTAGLRAPERELRKENAASAVQAPTDRLDAAATARAAPSAADAAQPKSSLNETVALSRQALVAAPVEIVSPDPSVRWRISGNGSVEHTTNGGTSWEAVPTGVSTGLTAGASPSRTVCWLVGRAGTVLLSTDGRTWQRLPFPEMADLTAVQATDARTATVTTADGRTFRTTDGGVTWN